MNSPKPPKKKTKDLDFYEALKFIMQGKSVTKAEWKDRAIFGILKDTTLQMYKDGEFHNWILSDGDIQGDDFLVL